MLFRSVEVRTNLEGQKPDYSFLVKYTGNSKQTADKILNRLLALGDGYPQGNMPQHKIQLLGLNSNDRKNKVFVGGFPAQVLSPKLWSYRWKDNSSVYLTVTREGIVTYRKLIYTNKNEIKSLSIPGQRMVKSKATTQTGF